MKTLLTVIAYGFLCAFLYILISNVPRMDLGIVIAGTLLLTGWDLFFHDRVRMRRHAPDPDTHDPDAPRDQGRPVAGASES